MHTMEAHKDLGMDLQEEKKIFGASILSDQTQEVDDSCDSTIPCSSDEEVKSNNAYSSEDEVDVAKVVARLDRGGTGVDKFDAAINVFKYASLSVGTEPTTQEPGESQQLGVSVLGLPHVAKGYASDIPVPLKYIDVESLEESVSSTAHEETVTCVHSTAPFAPRGLAPTLSLPGSAFNTYSHISSIGEFREELHKNIGSVSIAEPEPPCLRIQEPRVEIKGLPGVFRGILHSTTQERETGQAQTYEETFVEFDGKWRLVREIQNPPITTPSLILHKSNGGTLRPAMNEPPFGYPLPCTYSFNTATPKEAITGDEPSDPTLLSRVMKLLKWCNYE